MKAKWGMSKWATSHSAFAVPIPQNSPLFTKKFRNRVELFSIYYLSQVKPGQVEADNPFYVLAEL
jgi:hypothetical protein